MSPSETSSFETELDKMLNFIETADWKIINQNIVLVKEDHQPRLVVAFKKAFKDVPPFPHLNILFPQANPKVRSYFLNLDSVKDFPTTKKRDAKNLASFRQSYRYQVV